MQFKQVSIFLLSTAIIASPLPGIQEKLKALSSFLDRAKPMQTYVVQGKTILEEELEPANRLIAARAVRREANRKLYIALDRVKGTTEELGALANVYPSIRKAYHEAYVAREAVARAEAGLPLLIPEEVESEIAKVDLQLEVLDAKVSLDLDEPLLLKVLQEHPKVKEAYLKLWEAERKAEVARRRLEGEQF